MYTSERNNILSSSFFDEFICRYIQSKKGYWSKQNIPVESNAFLSRFVKQLHLAEKEIVEKQCGNKVFGVYEFSRPTLWVAEPEIIRNILSKDFHIFPNRRVSNRKKKTIKKTNFEHYIFLVEFHFR